MAKKTKSAPQHTETAAEYWLDVASRFFLGCFFALCATTYFQHVLTSLKDVQLATLTLPQAANILSVAAITFFMGLVAYLYAVRLPSLTRFAGWVPAVTAVLGSFSAFGLLLLKPRMDLSPEVHLFSTALVIFGNFFAIYSLRYLGKSFSILAQGRRLVTGGPYRYVRHPVYLAEAISTLGAMISFLSVEAFMLVAAQLFCQLLRMGYEEQVLEKAFPEYKDYRRRTARLIPGVY